MADFNVFFNKKYFKEDARAAAAILSENRKEGEGLLGCSGNATIALLRYYSPPPPWWGITTEKEIEKALREVSTDKIWIYEARLWELDFPKLISGLKSKGYMPI